jgi:hypothetical protein
MARAGVAILGCRRGRLKGEHDRSGRGAIPGRPVAGFATVSTATRGSAAYAVLAGSGPAWIASRLIRRGWIRQITLVSWAACSRGKTKP